MVRNFQPTISPKDCFHRTAQRQTMERPILVHHPSKATSAGVLETDSAVTFAKRILLDQTTSRDIERRPIWLNSSSAEFNVSQQPCVKYGFYQAESELPIIEVLSVTESSLFASCSCFSLNSSMTALRIQLLISLRIVR